VVDQPAVSTSLVIQPIELSSSRPPIVEALVSEEIRILSEYPHCEINSVIIRHQFPVVAGCSAILTVFGFQVTSEF